MALGATVKVKMDTSAVKRGMASIGGMFRRLGSVMKGIGGAMRKSLVPLIGILAGVGFAIKKIADRGSELSDMAVQTGASIKQLILMETALGLAGASARDTGRMLGMMASNIQEAKLKAGAARDAFNDLGIHMGDIKDLGLAEAFDTIMRAIRDGRGPMKSLELDMEAIFGGRIGGKLLRFGKDYDANMKRALEASKPLAKFWSEQSLSLDSVADSIYLIGQQLQVLVGALLTKSPLEKWFKSLQKMVPVIIETLEALFADPKGVMKDAMRSLGRMFGEGFKEELGFGAGVKINDAAEAAGKAAGAAGGFGGVGGRKGGRVEAILDKQTNILERIERKEGAIFA